MNTQIIAWLIILLSVFLLSSCQQKNYLNMGGCQTSNIEKSYLLLISLDGFRWDYVDKYKPPHLTNFIREGVKSSSLIPSYPTKTFPNHYTIATGLYPDHHGLLGNRFYNYGKEKMYSIRDRSTVEDGSFYHGSPIWVEASLAEMITASYFFVGTEADIRGVRPTYYYNYDSHVTKEKRVEQVLTWFTLPDTVRPQLVTMYYADIDNVGHWFGPNDEQQIKEALLEVDNSLGSLFAGLEKTGLPINIIIVSDHGMTEIPTKTYIPEEIVHKDEWYQVINNGSIMSIHPHIDVEVDSVYHYLKSLEDNFKVYYTKDVPYFEIAPNNENWGPIQVVPNEGYYFISARILALKKNSDQKVFGQHGYRPEMKDMHGIFYANGPAFKSGYEISSVKNIHIFPLMCKVLGLEIPEGIDGRLAEINEILR